MDFKAYKNDTIKKYNESVDALRSHLVTYIAVNIGIFLLNMLTSSGFPWFLFVVGGWGIGMISHWGTNVVLSKNLSEIKEINSIDDIETERLVKFQEARSSFYLHFLSNIAVSIYLLTINIITSTAFMWAFIPIIGMGIGMASHWANYSNKKRRNNFDVEENNMYYEVEENLHLIATYDLKNSILDIIDEVRAKFKNFGSDLLPKIDEYVETISLLIEKELDLEKSLKDISLRNIEEQKDDITKKLGKTTSNELSNEYKKLLKDLDTQIKTLEQLQEDKELLSLKVTAAINNLKNLKLELIRLKSKTSLEDISIINDFANKSNELAQYYKDLLDSYDELHQ